MIEVLRVVFDIWRVRGRRSILETIRNSQNFATLMHFDPMLEWITRHLPVESLKRVLCGPLTVRTRTDA
jgi:hypothetical protein